MDDLHMTEWSPYGQITSRSFLSSEHEEAEVPLFSGQTSPVDLKFPTADLFKLIGSNLLYLFVNPIDISGESNSTLVRL